MKKIKIAVLPGDGIGSDVMMSSLPIFQALNIPVELAYGEIGWNNWVKDGNPVPDATWKLIDSADATLLGATTSKPEKEAYDELPEHLKLRNLKYVSPIVQLRQKMDLYANIRPCFNIKGCGSDFNFTVIRENIEGLYSGLDYYPVPDNLTTIINMNPRWKNVSGSDASCSIRLQTQHGLKRLFEFAFRYAQENNINKVTLADKPNVLRRSSIFTRNIFESIAEKYPDIRSEIHNVDAVGLWLVKRPEQFGVIVAENMFGDILSDVGAGVMGGLGFAPSANIGSNGCYFEPVHGSAPRVGRNTANPSAMFLTISLLLERFGYQDQAGVIRKGIKQVIKYGQYLTYDLGGSSSTQEMAENIIDFCLHPYQVKRISFLATGNEIVNGDVQDSNTSSFAKIITDMGGIMYQRLHVSDKKNEITSALNYLLNDSDAVIVTGGLGPTSDDTTRFSISDVTKKPLYFDQDAWDKIAARLNSFGLTAAESNRQQALFPEGATVYPNDQGTAPGACIEWNNKQIFMLPGPPRECKSIFSSFVIDKLKNESFFMKMKSHRWLTLGLIEGEIAPLIDKVSKLYSVDVSYKWFYPYLEINLVAAGNESIDELVFKINNILDKNIVSKDGRDPFEILNNNQDKMKHSLFVIDNIVFGRSFDSKKLPNIKLVSPSNSDLKHRTLEFTVSKNILDDLDHSGSLEFQCVGYMENTVKYTNEVTIPNRGPEVIDFANAYVAWQINRFIDMIGE